MKRLLAILAVLASIPLYIVAVLFLIAASSQASRALVGLVVAALATVLLVAGIRQLRRLAEIHPEALKTEAVNQAKRLGGELTVSQLRAEFRISEELATSVLDELVAEGSARREQRTDRVVYVFTGLLPSLKEKVCPYCGTKLPVRTALRKCPNCGGSLEITKT